jgi:hypothetical protein
MIPSQGVAGEDAMRIGLMIGSDKERPRAQRLAGLVEDARAAESSPDPTFPGRVRDGSTVDP